MERIQLTAVSRKAGDLRATIKAATGADVQACYQCGKCSAGCPAAFAMDHTVRQVVRLVQLGLYEQALRSQAIWICAQCETCSSRCPRQVDPAKVMEALRIEAKKAGYIGDKKVDLFNELFLQSVEKNGRVNEGRVMVQFNLHSGQPLKDAKLGPSLMSKGKISLGAEKIQASGSIGKIFAKVRAKRGGHK